MAVVLDLPCGTQVDPSGADILRGFVEEFPEMGIVQPPTDEEHR